MPHDPSDVADWYNEHTETFVRGGDDIIQSCRPDDTMELMQYLMRSIPISDGMRILDAGCGIGGPAIYLATHAEVEIDAITISQVEADVARKRLEAAQVTRVHLQVGDYHALEDHYAENRFDAVLFLESLGHAQAPHAVLASAYEVLKPDGFVYIKDFVRNFSDNPDEQRQIDEAIELLNKNYRYNTRSLDQLTADAAAAGFRVGSAKEPDFIASARYKSEFEAAFARNCDDVKPIAWLEIKLLKDL